MTTDTNWEDDLIMEIMTDCLAKGLTVREAWFVAVSWIEGNVVAHRSDVLKIICSWDDPHPTPEQIAEVWCSSDRPNLIRWFDRCLTATNATDVLAD